MPTVHLPDFWVLFDADRKPCGSLIAVRQNGDIHCSSAEQAWAEFEPRARDRQKRQRDGWKVIPVEHEDCDDYWHQRRRPPEHREHPPADA